MTNQEFIFTINAYGKQSRNLIEGNGGYNIKRGMAHAISGYVEDLFALFIAQKLNSNKIQYLVDKVTSIRLMEGERAKSFKPDVSLIKENILTHYFDLKTNMGWNRHFENYLREKDLFINSLQGKKAWIHHSKEDVQHIEIKDDLVYQMVVVYGGNINQDLLKRNLEQAKNYKNVKVHILLSKNKDHGRYEINETAFDDIFNSLKV